MRRVPSLAAVAALTVLSSSTGIAQSPANPYAREPKQTVDEAYTRKMKEYTTASYFTSPLVDYLPASKTVPTPQAVLGDIAGAPGKLPYVQEVHQYMRMVEKASPRVKVFSIGKSEEGREMIAVAVSSEANLAKLDENRARLAKLADPRVISLNDAEADKLVDQSVPVYYITGAIHSPETGSPTALMELVYRLAVDESPYIQKIRGRIVTLITPVVEVDGRDRQVDVYRWHLANPDKHWPGLIYWGKYVAHDNNRDAMALTLNLTRNVLNTYVDWKAQVLHDLHESVAYLYDNTVGDGPYNAWLDPILTDEWQMIGWHNVSEMTKMGMPGVFTHGTFDTWTPGYLMFIAATHNGISRLYETFGNGGADTLDRTLGPNETSRTWYRQNPPLPKAKWSQRNNNNYQQTGLLVSLNHFADNKNLFLKNFYLKSKRSILKAKTEGPAAYVFPGDDPRLGPQADLLRVLQLQGCEVSRATEPFTVTIPGARRPARETTDAPAGDGERQRHQPGRGAGSARQGRQGSEQARAADVSGGHIRLAHGSAVQPDRRHAARLPVLGARRSPAESVRRHRVDVRRALQRQSGPCDRRQGARREDGARERRAQSRWSRDRHGLALRDQPQRRPVARDAPVSIQGRADRRRRRAVRGQRPEVQSRLLPGSRNRRRRSREGRGRARTEGRRADRAAAREGSPGEGRTRCAHAHVDQHAGRRLVAARPRSAGGSVHLHQHPGRRRGRRSRLQVRRHPLPARRPQCGPADHHGPRRCTATRCPGRRRR